MRLPFERLAHLVTVPVSLGEVETRFVLDTGIGLTLLAETMCARVGCAPTGETFSGPRMSGQEVSLPLGRVSALAFGDLAQRDVAVGILDLEGFPAELAEIGGFLSLAFFADRAFTVDYPDGCVVLETPETLAERSEAGVSVEVDPHPHGPALDVFLPLAIPGGAVISAEVDMGSGALILDERFATEVGVDLEAADPRCVEGTDETGGAFTRWFTTLPGSIHPAGAPELAQEEPEVMFQRIIHDGLIGDAFLSRQPVTYDLPHRRMIFGRVGSYADDPPDPAGSQ